MLLLDSTSDLVDLITSAAGSVDVHASWVDWDGTDSTPGSDNLNITTAATTTIVPAPGAGVQRNVLNITVKNKHASASNTTTLRHTDGTHVAELPKVTLLFGEMLALNEIGNWVRYDRLMGAYTSPSTGVDPQTNGFRLSGVSATPVMSADSTTLGTIFMCQYKGGDIALFDGVNWQLVTPASEVSLAVTGRTTDLPFDIFCFLSAGVATLEFLNWTNATTRATGLTKVDGVWTKAGDATRRYMGSCRARSATTFHFVKNGDDLPCKFDLFNADNRIEFPLVLRALTNTWAYTLATWRQAQASANYQVDIMVGLQEEFFTAMLMTTSRNSTISIPRHCGIGFDSTTAIHANSTTSGTANEVASIESGQSASISIMPVIGSHRATWLEISTATGACTWVGDDGLLRLQSGMTGSWKC